MPGHSRSHNGVASLAYAGHPCWCAAFSNSACQNSAWATGSSPVATQSE